MDPKRTDSDDEGVSTLAAVESKVAGYFVVVPPGAAYHRDIVAELFGKLAKRWVFILLLTSASAAFALLLSLWMPRTYRAEVTMVAAEAEQSGVLGRLSGGLGGLAALAGIGPQSSAVTQEALAVLDSADFTADFIRTHGILPLLFPDESLVTTGGSVSAGNVRTEQDGIKKFNEDIRRVVVDDDAGVIRVRIYWGDPALAAAWANEIVRRLNERMRSIAIADSDRSLAFLRKELDGTSAIEVRQGIYELIRTQMERRMLASVREQYAFRIIDPAIAPDPDKYIHPVHLLFGVIGGMAGFCLAVFFVVVSRKGVAHT